MSGMGSQLNYMFILTSIIVLYSCIRVSSQGNTQYAPRFDHTDPYIDLPEDYPVGSYIRSINATDQNGNDVIIYSNDAITNELIYLNQTKFGSDAGADLYLKAALDRDYDSSMRKLRFYASNNKTDTPGSITLPLNILDVNDVTPKFEVPSYQFNIFENSTPNGSVVFENISVTDNDTGLNQYIDLTLESSEKFDGVFKIHKVAAGPGHVKGQILLFGELDYEQLSFYQYVIKATDNGSPKLTGTADLIIKVTDVQDTPPFFQGLPYMKDIEENTVVGKSVLTVRAEDGDRGVPNKIKYSFVNNSNCEDFFNLNSSSGVVTVAKTPDRDDGVIRNLSGVCRLTVNASEDQTIHKGGNITATTPMTITIQDVNDNSPKFEMKTYRAEVRENLTNIPITIINQNRTGIYIADKDQAPFSKFVFEIKFTNGSGYTDLSAIPLSIISEGEIRIQLNNKPFDYEKEHQIEFQIWAIETANSSHTDNCTVILDIIDTNDNSPVFTNHSYNVTIKEGSTNLSHVVTVNASDADSGTYGEIHYELRNGGQQFVINNSSGEIRTNCAPEELDYEKRNIYYLTAEAIDGGFARTQTSVIINLEDVNDNPPKFISNRYEVTVQENKPVFSTNPFTVKAEDRDQPGTNNSAIRYELFIDKDLKSNFTINSTSGEIKLIGSLDYEKINFTMLGQPDGRVKLYAIAKDLGIPSLSSNTTIIIHVQDENDNTPEFNQSLYIASFPEGKHDGLNITSVFATDDDASYPNNDISYYISKGGLDRFFIDSKTGTITTSNFNFDRETMDTYNLTVIARDLGSPPKTGTAGVFITLIDVNDQNPTFSMDYYHREVWENATVNTSVITCNASDPDIDHNLTYSIINITAFDENSKTVNVSLVNNYFNIDSSTGKVFVKSELDRETAARLELTILVTDTNGVRNAPQNDTATVFIDLHDINDNAPQFTQNLYKSTNIRESATNGEIVITVTATDTDVDNHITYNISKNPKDGFSIDERTGLITVLDGTKLDREDQPQMNITVMACDGLNNSTAIVVVDLIDVNDNAPAFVPTKVTFKLQENNYNYTFVHEFSAVDNDTGMNANLTYFIEDQTSPIHFHIDKYSGNLSVNGILDRETIDHYTLVLLCKDNPTLEAAQKTGTLTIKITVEDENDNTPQFDKHTYSGELSENSIQGRVILTVSATDKDAGLNGTVYYDIIDRNDTNLFRINNETGVVMVANILLDKAGLYLLNVSAEDRGNPPRQNSTVVSINVLDENNHAPEFLDTQIKSSIYECARNGTFVANVTATDKDKAPYNKNITYKFENSSTPQALPFVIDTVSGIISVKGKLKASTKNQYRIKVNASDHGIPKRSTISDDIIINIKDVNDNPPEFNNSHYETRITEEKEHENFYKVVAIDIDKDSNTTYSLDDNSHNFSINKFTGQLSLNSPIDREKVATVNLTVHAKDSTLVTNYSSQCDDHNQQKQSNASKTEINIVIDDINDNPPIFKSKPITVGVRRDLKQNTEIHNFKNDVTDLDIGVNAVHSFQRIGQFDASPESIKTHILNPTNNCPGTTEKAGICISGNGSVTLNMVFNANAKGTISFNVMAKDKAGNDTANFEITVVGDSQTLQMTIFAPKDEVSRKKDAIMKHLSEVLSDYKFTAHDVEPYVTADGKRDDFRTNLLFHVQENATRRILSAEEAKSLIDSNAGRLFFLRDKYRVTQIDELKLQQTSDNTDELKKMYVLVAVIALLGGVVLVLGYFLCNTITKYKRRLKAATIKTIDKDEKKELDFIPGSNEFAAKVNPLLNKEVKQPEVMPEDNDSVNSLDVNEVDYSNRVIRTNDMEEKEVIMDMYGDDIFQPDDNLDPIQLALNEHNRQLTENSQTSLLQNNDADFVGVDNPLIYEKLETTEV